MAAALLLSASMMAGALAGCEKQAWLQPRAQAPAAVAALGPRCYVADHQRGITALSRPELGVKEELPLAGGANGIALAPGGNLLLAASTQADQVVAFSTRGELAFRAAVGRGPHGVAVQRSGLLAYVANQASNDISVIDLRARREVRRIPCSGGPCDVLLVDGEQQLAVSLHATGEVALVDAAAGRELRRCKAGLAPYRMALDETAHLLYVTLFDQNEVVVLDAATLGENGRFATEEGPYGVVCDARGAVYVSNIEGGSITRVHRGELATPQTVEVGARPHGLALSPDGTELYVAIEGESRLSVRDASDLTEKRSLALPTAPSEVLFPLSVP